MNSHDLSYDIPWRPHNLSTERFSDKKDGYKRHSICGASNADLLAREQRFFLFFVR